MYLSYAYFLISVFYVFKTVHTSLLFPYSKWEEIFLDNQTRERTLLTGSSLRDLGWGQVGPGYLSPKNPIPRSRGKAVLSCGGDTGASLGCWGPRDWPAEASLSSGSQAGLPKPGREKTCCVEWPWGLRLWECRVGKWADMPWSREERDLFLSGGWEQRGCHFLEEQILEQDLEKQIDVGVWKQKKKWHRKKREQPEHAASQRAPSDSVSGIWL